VSCEPRRGLGPVALFKLSGFPAAARESFEWSSGETFRPHDDSCEALRGLVWKCDVSTFAVLKSDMSTFGVLESDVSTFAPPGLPKVISGDARCSEG